MNLTAPARPSSRQPVFPPAEAQAESHPRRRSVKQIERDLAHHAERLSANVDELVARITPSRLAGAGAAAVRSRMTTPDGRPRVEIVGALGGAVLVIGFLVWRARHGRTGGGT